MSATYIATMARLLVASRSDLTNHHECIDYLRDRRFTAEEIDAYLTPAIEQARIIRFNSQELCFV